MTLIIILGGLFVFAIIIAISLFIGYFSMYLTKIIFNLPDGISSGIWKIVIYTSLVMIIPIIGIIWAASIFYRIINKIAPKISVKRSIGAFVLYLIINAIISISSAMLFRHYFTSPFQLSGSSMEESYHDGEFIMVNKFSYKIGNPIRGDVVIFRPHATNGKEFYFKRIIGLSGDTLKIESGNVFLKPVGKTEFVKLDEGYLSVLNKGKTFLPMDVKETEFIVPEGQYFVMGDNRNNSADSRSCFQSCSIANSGHFVSRENVIGKLFVDFGYINIFHTDGALATGEWKWTHAPRFLDTPKDWIYKELK